jgi:hypothetical protein
VTPVVTLDRAAYGDRTPALQAVLDRALHFAPALPSAVDDRATRMNVARAVAQHLAAIRALGYRAPMVNHVEFLSGRGEQLAELWRDSAEWREQLGYFARDLLSTHEQRTDLNPPIWYSGRVRIFCVTVFATDERLRQMASRSGDDDAWWPLLCFLEEVIDSELVATLASDVPRLAVCQPLSTILEYGFLPLGWLDATFRLYVPALSGGRPITQSIDLTSKDP